VTDHSAIWHQLECGSYAVDLDCWLGLADDYDGPILDVGAGTGRLALTLAERGREVTALDNDPELLAALTARDLDGEVTTLCADAREFDLPRRFGLIIVAMLTVQLLGGEAGRMKFFGRAREALLQGGCLALAIADLSDEPAADGTPAAPDSLLVAGVQFSSQAVALHRRDQQIGIERRREIHGPDGSVQVLAATDWIDAVAATTLEAEGAAAGLSVGARRQIPESDDYVGSTVVCFNG
jgi:SAM-dependent methyltransferase